MKTLQPVDFSHYNHVFILTGAGISAASGLPTFRGPDGLLQKDAMWASDASNLPDSLPALWQLYGGLRGRALQARPNAAHQAIAALQKRWHSTCAIMIATQNVDGLHQRAGSLDVAELHGSVHRSRCTNPECTLPSFVDSSVPGNQPPACPRCAAPLRPDIVLFKEPLLLETLRRVEQALFNCDLFIAVGTSGAVAPASEFVRVADYVGARTILVNLIPMMPRNPYFAEEYLGPAEEILPVLFGVSSTL